MIDETPATPATQTTTEATPTTLQTTTTVKPGYRTTEFYLKLVATLLTALYASDVIPTEGVATKIAAIAATVLGYLGYAVSRTMVKKSQGAN